MAIRRIAAADRAPIIAAWNTYRTGGGEYARETALTNAYVDMYRNDPTTIALIDPATQTIALGSRIGTQGYVRLIFTLTNGLAAVTAVDTMSKAICNLAIAGGVTLLWGDYNFPPGVDPETTRAVRYFNSLTPPYVKTVTPFAGMSHVRFEADPVVLLAALTVRTP